MNDRLDRIRAAMAEEGLDALLVSSAVEDMFGLNAQNRTYVSGFTGSTGYVLVTRDRAIIALDFRYTEQGGQECVPFGFEVWKREGHHKEWIPNLIRYAELTGRKIGVSKADMSLAEYDTLQRSIEELPWALRPEIGPASPIIEKLRQRKTIEELMVLEKAIQVADNAFERVQAAVEPGMTERRIAEMVREAVRDLGASDVSFDTIVAAGPHGALPHASPRDVPVQAGEPIVIDMGARYDGYCSDLTRTFVVGEPPARFREIYDIVFAAQQAAIEGIEPGMTGVQADELARSVIHNAGYGDEFGHGLGHGVGLQVHEAPYLGPTSEDVIEEGMVFTIEPGIYLPGEFGVRIEDIVVLENGKARVLSHATKLTPAGAKQ
ncbi:MAG: aminopeptidase P family protein [Dehalococcoidia bacterium]|nr:aminopeptidase P family protein [Dehalococcoidia bacterium]